ncbi:hypothetical protein DRF65_05575 [Chryseobacterium pennae]|uniref:Uncharacterized protein n=1 Tax=Chryseobacterium pennae TaxID=2258962 RepID=A0A3D9CDH9_9FLAO|nr:hypothetical protein [Chryseobacterium pennae]REC63561.1 hypothetical protein DRF65_05575 [Chryseobacterium pennae]
MKKLINIKALLALGAILLNPIWIFSEIGIHTPNPQGVFNVDAGKNNNSLDEPTAIQQLDDFVVNASGNVGIGTTVPSKKLEIVTGGTDIAPVPGIKLNDGYQKPDYVLTSDADGVGIWKAPAVLMKQLSLSGTSTLAENIPVSKYAGVYVDLPLGRWAINLVVAMTFSNADAAYSIGNHFVRFRVEDDTNDHGVVGTDVSKDAVEPRLASASFGLS